MDFLSKVFERIAYKRVSGFMEKFNIINNAQYGFRRGRSTGNAILSLTDAIYDTFNDGQYIISVLLDFSKAFDTVDHSILLRKLFLMGIRGTTLDWFKSYLINRRQCVNIKDSCSPYLPINVGVPQGSILGPLLFLMYINDFSNCSTKLSFIHFADDTTVFIKGNNLPNLLAEVNCEMINVENWLCANKLSLNIDKTSFMVHSSKKISVPAMSISIRDMQVKYVTSAKFLGVIIDDTLKFKDHIKQVRSRLCRYSGIMRNLSKFLPSWC